MTLKSRKCYCCGGEIGFLSKPFLLNKQSLVYFCDQCFIKQEHLFHEENETKESK